MSSTKIVVFAKEFDDFAQRFTLDLARPFDYNALMTSQELRLTNKSFFGYIPSRIRSKELEFIKNKSFINDYRILTKMYFGLTIETEKGCWINSDWSIYRHIRFNGKNIGTHRLSYMTLRGPIYGNRFICHYCDRKGCTNPWHLFQGTQQDNIDDYKMKNNTWQPPLRDFPSKVDETQNMRPTLTENELEILIRKLKDMMESYKVSPNTYD